MNTTQALLCVILPAMNKAERIIYALSLVLLSLELAIMLISILSRPLTDTYLRGWGIAVLITAAVAVYGYIRKRKAR